MTVPRTRTLPSSRFSDLLHATWKKAIAEGSLRIKCGTQKNANSLRFKLNSLRKALLSEGDLLGLQAQPFQIAITISQPDRTHYIEIDKGNKMIDNLLIEAGVEVEADPPPPTLSEDLSILSDSPYLSPKIGPKKGPS